MPAPSDDTPAPSLPHSASNPAPVAASSSTSSASINANAQTWTEPPWSGWIETTGDALLILEAARRGLIPRVTRRLVDSERKMITSGSVFVFDEDESGIKRWTDGFFWSPSRILGNFLLYRETDKRGSSHRSRGSGQTNPMSDDGEDGGNAAAGGSVVGRGGRGGRHESHSLSRPKHESANMGPDRQRERTLVGSLTNSYKFKPDGLMKKTFSLAINGVSQHLISYYKVEDVENGRLRAPSSLPEIASLDISPEYLDKMHFRNPPKVEIGIDGLPRYRGEADDIIDMASPSGHIPLPLPPPDGLHHHSTTTNSNKRGVRYDPYASGAAAAPAAASSSSGTVQNTGKRSRKQSKHTKSPSGSDLHRSSTAESGVADPYASDPSSSPSNTHALVPSTSHVHMNPYHQHPHAYIPAPAAPPPPTHPYGSYYAFPPAPTTAATYPQHMYGSYHHPQQTSAGDSSPSPSPTSAQQQGATSSPQASTTTHTSTSPTNPYPSSPPQPPGGGGGGGTSQPNSASNSPTSMNANLNPNNPTNQGHVLGYYNPYYPSYYSSSSGHPGSSSASGATSASGWPTTAYGYAPMHVPHNAIGTGSTGMSGPGMMGGVTLGSGADTGMYAGSSGSHSHGHAHTHGHGGDVGNGGHGHVMHAMTHGIGEAGKV